MEALVLTLVKSVGAKLATQIAEGLADGMNIEALKSKEEKLKQELEVLKTKIDDWGKSTIEAIRKQKITSAANRVMNCFSDLRDATEGKDAKLFADYVHRINSQDGVQHRLNDMNAVLMKDEGKDLPALLPPLSKDQWEKLQNEGKLDYGIQEFEQEQEATLNYPIMIERLGLSLVLLYHRTREDTDAATKETAMEIALKNSDKRVKAWRDLWNDRKKTCPAYDTLWKEIKKQRAPEPVYKAPFIRSIQAAFDNPGAGVPACQAGDVLDARLLGMGMGGWQDCWQKPSYAIYGHEFEFSFKPETGRWIIHSMSCMFDAKLIPAPNTPNNQPYIRLRCNTGSSMYQVVERTVSLVVLPLTLPPSVQLSKLTSWNSGSARTFIARVENHSSYTLIPRLRDAHWAYRGDLHGKISSFECPVLPGGTSYLAGHSGGLWTGGTGLFDFAIWSSPSAITDSSQKSEKEFQDLKCFHPSTSDYDEQVGYQPAVGAEFLGSLVLMVSVSYGGNPKGAMYASDYWPNEIVSLKEAAWFTGDYKNTGGSKREMKVVNVEWDIQQGDHAGQPGTWFKVCNK
ncbi:unnamed protein product [Alternaria burnsii]|nr:unnamed protein product [Alternaria burnsii]